MGILAMMGLVTAEEHATVKKERNDAERAFAAEIAKREAAEAALVSKQAIIAATTKERDEVTDKYSEMSGICSERDAEILGLRAQLDAATEVIAELKPDAEATRRRRANDANRVRPSRSKKVEASTDGLPASKAKAAAKKAVRK